MRKLAFLCLVVFAGSGFSGAADTTPPASAQKAVLVTGASSGIGRNAAAYMGLDLDSPLADRSRFKEPDVVVEVVMHALFDANPKRRYMVVPEQREAEVTINKAIEADIGLPPTATTRGCS